MSELFNKIGNRLSVIKSNYQKDLSISRKFAILNLSDSLLWSLHFKKLSYLFYKKKEDYILNYLQNELREVVCKYSVDSFDGEQPENAPIWVCWWTGEEDAPLLVKQCIKSIKNNAGSHSVILITKYNYRDYVDIPAYILDKVDKGNMCLAHFADYIRVALLKNYGGLWLDATVFCSKSLPEWYFQSPIFTCKRFEEKCRYISRMRWTSFCLGGFKGNVFYKFLTEAFECYWNTHNEAIDYLFFDYLIELAYRNIPSVKENLDRLRINNLSIDDLQTAMENAMSFDQWDNIINEDTVIYKLSWRVKFQLSTDSGTSTVYDYFLKLDL